LRNIFFNLNISVEEQLAKISLIESVVKTAKVELQERRAANLSTLVTQSRDGAGKTPATGVRHLLPSAGGAKKLYA
jgi:hypothetical protein